MNLAALLMTLVLGGYSADAQAALADRARFPAADHPYLYYLSLEDTAPEHRQDLSIAIRLMVASSSLQPIVERCTPVAVLPERLYRIDLRDLGWEHKDWKTVLKDYPYRKNKGHRLPLLIKADWLLVELADATESDAYYRLLFGGDKIPAKRDDWLDLLKVDRTKSTNFDPLRFGQIESESGVAKQPARWLESHPVLSGSAGGYAWGTRDVLEVTRDKDPLENLTGNFDHDGEEWIVGIPKISLATGDRGTLQVYLLSDGQGNRVDEAPVDLVEDSTLFRGTREIRNPGSCVQCHGVGLNQPTTNDFKELIRDGVDTYAEKETQQQIEAFHLGSLALALDRANEDFGAIVQQVCGVSGIEAAKAFKRAVNVHDTPLDLAATAREIGTTPVQWRAAIASDLATGKTLGARIAGLAHGRTIPREAWEYRYAETYQQAKPWR